MVGSHHLLSRKEILGEDSSYSQMTASGLQIKTQPNHDKPGFQVSSVIIGI